MNVISGLRNSGFLAQSAYSAEVATKDNLGRDITATYLTSHQDLSDYQTTAGMVDYQTTADMTAYQPAGSYATTNELEQVSADITATIPSTAGLASESYVQTNSAVLTAMIADKQDTLTFGYDEQDRINSINSSALAGGGDVPEDVMVESAIGYNAVNEISGYNGSAIAQYGAEKQWLVHDGTLVHLSNSAQYALGCNISALQRLMGIDETVLWEGEMNTTAQTGQFSEEPNNFRILRTITLPDTPGQRPAQINDFDMSWNSNDTNNLYAHWQTYNIASNTYSGQTWYLSSTNGGLEFKLVAGIKQVNGTVTTGLTTYQGTLRKIIGIGRKS